MNGTGDKPKIENGAAGVATTMPQVFRLLKPKRINAIASAESMTPTPSMLIPFWRGTDFIRKLRRRTASEITKISPKEMRQLKAVAI